MQIRVYSGLRELFGQARLHVSLDGKTTMGEVLESLASAYPAFGVKLWDAEHHLMGYVTVLLNGRSIDYLQGLATPVSESDVISLFPPVGGG